MTSTGTSVQGSATAVKPTAKLSLVSFPTDQDIDSITLEAFASQISENSKILTDFLKSADHPQPSFGRDAPASTLPENAPESIQIARTNLMEAALRVYQLALGPKEFIPTLAVGVCYATF